ncbi:MAG: hypothetical protein IKF53_01065 [Clostridia bacterium]|nr:hypothetical protein [Clostridia bacterium]
MLIKNRKNNRLRNYDYSSEGYYYITVCTANKQKILCKIVGDGTCDVPNIEYSVKGIVVDKYVVMPNHIHLIVKITKPEENGSSQAPALQNINNARFIFPSGTA